MTIIWIDAHDPLPDPAHAPVPASGLAAAGLDLSPSRLHEAYRKGLFPWYSPGEPVLWWSPDPRMLLRCEDFHLGRSLAKRVRQFDRADDAGPGPILRVTLNQAFPAVIAHCAQRGATRIGLGAARAGQDWRTPVPALGRDGTWITPDIMAVYTAWHRMGHAHSVETWIGDRLAGGLYGVSLGQCFFGESMFSLAADTSKIALAYLVRHLQARGAAWIDCQQDTPHLASLGARPVERPTFLAMLASSRDAAAPAWGCGRLRADGRLEPLPAGLPAPLMPQ
ncbi:MAG: leucyl/phenylalanyl-tRNA--protein transferase [Castellaniella sp.]|uniref:leucyl/phenylalanyl-tRNA--protein transferase n=1 Tax=Castellaniella sp. TaxID=1955812 RepID=UPI002A36CD52|nr:leucyl/phenylalanyl-tRNA--protein transferase [Castellaniella sp.]MDY0308979.1 leucyl/phenylalanyl-tRNA--protein transferase [Castellaniella sp.]